MCAPQWEEMANAQGSRSQRREEARAARQESERHAAAEAARRRRLVQLGTLVALAAVVVVVAIVLSSGGAKAPQKKPGEKVAGQALAAQELAGIPQHGDALGNPKAPYTLVEYGDLVCPACKAYSDDIIPGIVQKHVRTGKLRMEFKAFGFVRPWSTPAARYTWAAGEQNKLWSFSKLWYLNQGDETTDYVNDAFARRIASGVPGLNADKLIADSRSAAVKARVAQTAREFQAFGFNATPSFAGGTTGGTLKPLDLSQDPAKAVAKLVGG
jgi:protein-disulfide isomerase